MGLLKTLIVGREDGLRAKIRQKVSGGRAGPSPSPTARPTPPPPPAGERSLGLKPEPPRDVTPPDGFEVVLHKDALKPGMITEIIIGGTAIAVANVDGSFYALSNACPHADGPLGEGALSGTTLTCPYHGWQYDVSDGTCLTNADVRVPSYEVRVVDTAVCVRI